MAMKQVMTIAKARHMADSIAAAYGRFGAQTSVPYSSNQLVEIITVLNSFGNFDGPTKEELTKAARQLTACKAREAGLRKKVAGDGSILLTDEDNRSALLDIYKSAADSD